MKPKFAFNDTVKTLTAIGVIKAVATFEAHIEYLVALPDQTASWHHEHSLKPATSSPATETPSTPK